MRRSLNYKEIIEKVIELEGFTPEELKMKCRKRELVFARQIAMFFCRKLTTVSLALTGSYFGRDHATVLHAVKTINNLIDTDREIRERVERYENILKCPKTPDTSRIKYIVKVRPLTRFAYRDILTPEQIGRYATYMSEDTIIREIRKLLIYERYYNLINN